MNEEPHHHQCNTFCEDPVDATPAGEFAWKWCKRLDDAELDGAKTLLLVDHRHLAGAGGRWTVTALSSRSH